MKDTRQKTQETKNNPLWTFEQSTSSCISDIIRIGAGRSKGIQKQCAVVFERGLWSRVATTQPRGLSSQGVAL
ncbi:MAG TPA: hypothetical protein VF623_02545 [Segetibacter sp.]